MACTSISPRSFALSVPCLLLSVGLAGCDTAGGGSGGSSGTGTTGGETSAGPGDGATVDPTGADTGSTTDDPTATSTGDTGATSTGDTETSGSTTEGSATEGSATDSTGATSDGSSDSTTGGAEGPVFFQFGTDANDSPLALALDSTDTIVTVGGTLGHFLGGIPSGYSAAFVHALDEDGDAQWSDQFDGMTPEDTTGLGVAVDADDAVYVAGYTLGGVGGHWDALLRKLDAGGSVQWSLEYSVGATNDSASDVAIDSLGNPVVVGGSTTGAYVRKYAPQGATATTVPDPIWTTLLDPTGGEAPSAVVLDASDVAFVTGTTNGAFGGTSAGGIDGFVTAVDADGNELTAWRTQFGTAGDDRPQELVTDGAGNLYVVGYTTTQVMFSFDDDAFVAKLDASGVVWMQTIGTLVDDEAHGVAIDGDGNIVVVGSTLGVLGEASVGGYDVFVRTYDPDGNELSTQQWGTDDTDRAASVVVDSGGALVVSGTTYGDLAGMVGTNDSDAFVAILAP